MENLNIHLVASLTVPQVIEQFGKLFDNRSRKTHEAVLELQYTVSHLLRKLDERDKQNHQAENHQFVYLESQKATMIKPTISCWNSLIIKWKWAPKSN